MGVSYNKLECQTVYNKKSKASKVKDANTAYVSM